MARWGRTKNRPGKERTLSRDERTKLYGEAGFTPLQDYVRCETCRDNELSPPSPADPDSAQGRSVGRPQTFDCPDCFGRGVRPARGKERLDPYMTPKAVFG